MRKILAFGCFDDCFNYVGAYFILKGNSLYSEIFFNHQFIMPYMSALIQYITDPQSIYEFIIRHRQFALFFAFFFDALIVYRFKKVGLSFVVIYESTKYYFFGDRFLAEGFIVYPLVYLLGLIWDKLNNSTIRRYEYFLIPVLVWFVIFAREPYSILALLMFIILLWNKKDMFYKKISLLLFLTISLIGVLSHNLNEYFFNLVTFNFFTTLSFESSSNQIISLGGLFKIFLYPVYILISGNWSLVRQGLIVFDLVFLFLIISYIVKYKKIWNILFLFLILGFANIRFVEPGTVFYEAFHMLPWYALFIFSIPLLFSKVYKINFRKELKAHFLILLMAIGYFIMVLSPASFVYEKVDRNKEFLTNFGNYLWPGEVVKDLSNENHTLFLDGFDDLIYWQSGLNSPYAYSWYTSSMPRIKKYQDARLDMFKKTPPNFYYGSCKEGVGIFLPEFIKNEYIRVYFHEKPTCLYIENDTLKSIGQEKINKKKSEGYSFR